MPDIVVAEPHQLGAAERDRIDEAGVNELVGKDRVVTADERRDDTGIREVAAAENQRGGIALEVGQAPFELLVDGQRAGDQARSGRSRAILVERLPCGGNHARMFRQAQIVVAGKVQELAPVQQDFAAGAGIDADSALRVLRAESGSAVLRSMPRDSWGANIQHS